MKYDPIVIVGSARTPIGNMLGNLSTLQAHELGGEAIKKAIERTELAVEQIDEVLMGCVLAAGLGQAPARQAAMHAGIPTSVGATTINKMCGSGMKAVMFAHDLLLAGNGHIYISGGMESMSNAPYLLPKARSGYRLGHKEIIDSLLRDGLEDAYDKGKLMGYFAEETAKRYKITRQQQDQFAMHSLERAIKATDDGNFMEEIAPITLTHKGNKTVVITDEGPDPRKLAKISKLKPIFQSPGTVTAANSSSISDGASALVLMRLSQAEKRQIKPIAKLCAHATYAHAPSWFTTAPVNAIKQLLAKLDWTINSVDLFEINEAFAVVTLVAMQELKLDYEKTNINGGACALGHPIGCSGTRIIVTLLHALAHHHLRRGIAAICIGGGEATAVAIELMT